MSYLILGAILVMLVILAAPISLGYDSVDRRFMVKWLGLTMTKRLEVEKPKKLQKIKPKKRKISALTVLRRLWQQRELCLELTNRVGRFVLEVFRTLKFRDSEASVSLPDPMWNGLLYAVVTNIRLENVYLSVNFEHRNYAKIWVTVFPYRVAGKLAGLFVRLPYTRLVRFAWELSKN